MKPLFDFFSLSRSSPPSKTIQSFSPKIKLRERTFLYGFPVKLKRSFYRTLSRIRGLGASRIGIISSFLGIPPFMFNRYLSSTKMSSVEGITQSFFTLDRALAKAYSSALFLKRKSGHYTGFRFSNALPARGQRTKTNAKTSKLQRRRNRNPGAKK